MEVGWGCGGLERGFCFGSSGAFGGIDLGMTASHGRGVSQKSVPACYNFPLRLCPAVARWLETSMTFQCRIAASRAVGADGSSKWLRRLECCSDIYKLCSWSKLVER
jgi:hypothetical protein